MLPTFFSTIKKREISGKPISSEKLIAILSKQANQAFQHYRTETNAQLNAITIPAYAKFAAKGSGDAVSALIVGFGRLTCQFASSMQRVDAACNYTQLIRALYQGIFYVCENATVPVQTARLVNVCINHLTTQVDAPTNYLSILLNQLKLCVEYDVKESLEASYLLAKYYAGCLVPLGDLDQSLSTFFDAHMKCDTDKISLALMYAAESVPAAIVYIQHELATGRYTPTENIDWISTISQSAYLKTQAIHYIKKSMTLALHLNVHPIRHDSMQSFFTKMLYLYEQLVQPDRTDAFIIEVLEKLTQLTTATHMRRLNA